MAGVMVANQVAVLAAACGIVLGVVVLVTGWRWLRNRTDGGFGRGVRVPRVGVIGWVPGGAW
ncbi:MAG: hypothetical protein ACRDTG_05930 [Pseudonocardiaceae bacterium]